MDLASRAASAASSKPFGTRDAATARVTTLDATQLATVAGGVAPGWVASILHWAYNPELGKQSMRWLDAPIWGKPSAYLTGKGRA